MVFCYKVITETAGPSLGGSPTRRVAQTTVPSSLSQLISCIDYEGSSDVLDEIPEKDWRLLAALARKREKEDERERLADQLRDMWRKEKEEREIVEAETTEQYKRYLHHKRQQERSWLERRRLQVTVEHQLRTGQLLDCIRHKERRSADVLAFIDDKKTNDIVDKALEEQARALLAADRRTRISVADECRRQLDLADAERRAEDALKRKNAYLRDASQRVAISNALSSWESSLLRQEVSALEAARRCAHAAHAALTDVRSARLAQARDRSRSRARKLAALTANMREAIRCGKRDNHV